MFTIAPLTAGPECVIILKEILSFALEWAGFFSLRGVAMNWLRQMMLGRYGLDQLSLFLLLVGMFCSLLASLLHFFPLTLLADVIWLLAVLRMFSRNLEKRRGENVRFLRLAGPWLSWLRQRRNQLRDRDHRYFTCPSCGQQLRVPRGKGKIAITCRRCGTVFHTKT